jgi:hypothetical protein
MSRITGYWAALASEHERLVFTTADQEHDASTTRDAPTRWAELASQRERLIDAAAPLGGLVSSSADAAGLRLVVRAA